MPVIIPQDLFAVAVQEVNITENPMPPPFRVNLGEDFNFENAQPFNPSDLDFDTIPVNVTAPPAASLELPSNLYDFADASGPLRIANFIYLSDALFLRRETNDLEVASLIISATVINQTIVGLDPPIALQFQRNPVL